MLRECLLIMSSTFNPPALPPEMVFMKVWNGSHKLSERLVTSRSGALLTCKSVVSTSFISTIERPYHNVLISTIGATSHESSLSLGFYFHGRRKGGYCTMKSGYCVFPGAAALHLALRTFARLFFSLFFPLRFSIGGFDFFPTSGFAILSVSAWYKSSR